MPWRPKQKQLTPEEALALARKELVPYWIGSGPLLVGVPATEGRRATVRQLDPSFERRAWIVLMVDLTTYAGEAAFAFACEWRRRYAVHDLEILLIAPPTYRFLATAQALQPLLGKTAPGFPVVLDHDGSLTEAFGAGAVMPKAILFSRGRFVVESSGEKWIEGLEWEIQKFLRSGDPGLPLLSPLPVNGDAFHDGGRIELGKSKGMGQAACGLKFTGKWAWEPDRVLTQDPAAMLEFLSLGARLSLVAQVPSGEEPSRMRIELNGDPVYQAVAGSNLSFSDDGGTDVRLLEPKLYHVLVKLPNGARQVTLKFPDADRIPVAVYRIQFGA